MFVSLRKSARFYSDMLSSGMFVLHTITYVHTCLLTIYLYTAFTSALYFIFVASYRIVFYVISCTYMIQRAAIPSCGFIR